MRVEPSPDERFGGGRRGASVETLLHDNERLRAELTRMAAERERLQAQLHESRTLEAVGRLAAGVAHDFNNLVMVITGYSQLLLKRLGPDDALRSSVEGIQGAAEWGVTLTRQLMAACRSREHAPVCLVSVNDVVATAEPILRLLLGEPHELMTRLDPDAGSVEAGVGRLEQVIANLVVTARDALGERGRVTISTKSIDVDDRQASQLGLPRPGRYVVLAVSDSDPGDDAAQAPLFEPYVSTAQPGRALGLGLASAYDVINRGGGAMRKVSGAGGGGSTFEVYLPGVDQPPRGERLRMPERDPLDGTETVLVVEDELPVRELIRDVLRLHGYTVLEAQDAADAIVLAARHEGPIALVVLDVVMPGIPSTQLFDELRATRAALRALFISGHTDELLRDHGIVRSGVQFLQKPFAVDALARKVREVLDAR